MLISLICAFLECFKGGSLVAQKVKNLPAMGRKGPLGVTVRQLSDYTLTWSALRPYYLKWGPRSQGSASPGNFKWRPLGPPRVSEPEFCTQPVCACMPSHFRHAQLFVILWTVACKAPLSMGFSRQGYWNGLSCPPLRDLLNPGIEPSLLCLLHWPVNSLPRVPAEKPKHPVLDPPRLNQNQ